jgi:hypothetical protein
MAAGASEIFCSFLEAVVTIFSSNLKKSSSCFNLVFVSEELSLSFASGISFPFSFNNSSLSFFNSCISDLSFSFSPSRPMYVIYPDKTT